MFGISYSQVKKSLLVSLCWLFFLSVFADKPFWSLRPDLHDHISNLHSTVLFWHKGIDIYKQPVNTLLATDTSEKALQFAKFWKWPKEELFILPERRDSNPLMIVWGQMPRPYPPGIYALLTPLALIMEAWGGFSERILILLVFTFCFVANLVFFQIRNLLGKVEAPKKYNWVMNLILASIYFEIIGWSLCGQYEVFGLFFLIPSLQLLNEKKYIPSFVYFSLSAFIHFRAILWILPALAVWITNFKNLISDFKKLKPGSKFGVILATTLGAIAGGIFLIVTKALLNNTPSSNVFARELMAGTWVGKHFVFILGLTLIGLYFIRQKNWLLLLGIANILLMFFKANFLQPWYVLYLLPILFAFRESKESFRIFMVRYACVVLIGSSFLNASPTEFYFVKKVLQLIF